MLKSALNIKSLAMFNLSSYGKRLGPDNFIFLKESSSLFLNKAWELLRGLTEYQRGAHFKTSEAITFSRHLSLHGHWNRQFSVVLGSVRLLSAHSSVHKKTEMPQFVNVRRIMLGHKRAAKSPLLQKFTDKYVKEKRAILLVVWMCWMSTSTLLHCGLKGITRRKFCWRKKPFSE